MGKLVGIFCGILLLCSVVWGVYAQQSSRDELERKRTALLGEIAATQKQLNATQADRNSSMAQLKALQAQLRARQRLIDNINQEMGHINRNIGTSSSRIESLSKELAQLKFRYARSVRYAYKNQHAQSMLAFLFSSRNFNEAMHRYQYMKKSRDFRKVQAGQIESTRLHLEQQIGILNSEKNKKVQLLQVEEQQKAGIEQETNTTNQMVAELRGKEKDLSAQIARSQAAAKKLDNAIKAEIAREVEIARQKAAEEARKKAEAEAQAKAEEEARKKAAEELARKQAEEKRKQEELAKWEAENRNKGQFEGGSNPKEKAAEPPVIAANKPVEKPLEKPVTTTAPPVPESKPAPKVASPSYKMTLTPDVQSISDNFAANRGRLPWPVEAGYIAVPFGRYQHPLEPKVTMENTGIDIAANANANVRAVFEGTVLRVVSIAGSYTVIINHGEYFTVYSYMSSVSVRQGDKVKFKQTIGNVGKNDDGENILHFEICKVGGSNNISNENPSAWIAR